MKREICSISLAVTLALTFFAPTAYASSWTNASGDSDWFNPDVAIAIAHRALGGKIEPLRRATHLEFNYRGPFLEEARN